MTPRQVFCIALALGSVTLAGRAFADVPPECSSFDTDVTCTAAEVDQPCSGGGTCKEVYCGDVGGSNGQNIYKCVACPSILDPGTTSDGGTCDTFGEACGDGGHCEKALEYCPSAADASTSWLSCYGPTPDVAHVDAGVDAAQPNGGDASANPPSDLPVDVGHHPGDVQAPASGGCSTSPVGKRGWFAVALGLAGLLGLGLGRRRRSRS